MMLAAIAAIGMLVPQVYVRVRPGDLDGTGALLAGSDVNLNLTGDLTNSGTIKGGVAGRNALKVSADNIRNLGGQMSADTLALQAKQDIDNVGGTLQAQSAAVLLAVSCPSVRNTSCVEFQSPFFQKTGFRVWFLMGLLQLLVLRCACFLCNFRHSRRHHPCPMRTVLFELS